jgi:hypothetical protein
MKASNDKKPYFVKGMFVWDREGLGPEFKNIPDIDFMMYQELLYLYYLNESSLPLDLGILMGLIEGRVSYIYGKHTLTEYRRLIRVLSRFFVPVNNGYVPRYPHSRFINPETDRQEADC